MVAQALCVDLPFETAHKRSGFFFGLHAFVVTALSGNPSSINPI
jgi:hypothetical protein